MAKPVKTPRVSGRVSKRSKFVLLIVAVLLLALPLFAAANSDALQSVIVQAQQSVQTQTQLPVDIVPAVYDEPVPLESGIVALSASLGASVEPAGTNIPVNRSTIVVTFSEAVNPAVAGTVTLNGTALAGGVWSAGNTVRTFTLPNIATGRTLDYRTRYDVVVSGFEAAGGGTMERNATGAFVTVMGDTADLVISKALVQPQGTIVPTYTFNFVINRHSLNGSTATAAVNTMPDISNRSIAFPGTGTPVVSGATQTTTNLSTFLLDGVTFPHAGVFAYRVTETAGSNAQMTYDTREFEVRFLVANMPDPDTRIFVSAVQIVQVVGGTAPTDNPAAKLNTLTFSNTYTPAAAELRVSKQVTGQYGNLVRNFSFSITVSAPAAITGTPPTYTAVVYNTATNTPVSPARSYTFTSGVAQTVLLRHGQDLRFTELHPGGTFTVTETGVANYTPTAVVTANAIPVTGSPFTAGVGQNLTVPAQTISQDPNVAAFTNANQLLPVTGLVSGDSNALLVFAAVIGLVLLLSASASKRKRNTSEIS
ncbi:MAG: hypothetical protein FWC81_00685 [Coriobacteriia bacterium]|nr:hypothetical protein [Coriobacteriia bacterium]MCL2606155.1 hypothetical protein [Coriobacteriia bacterium]